MVVFRDEERLSREYVPERFLFRDGELKQLLHYFSSVIYGERPFNTRVVISGAVGTGKTSLSKLFGQIAEREGRGSGVNLRYVHVNCRIHRSVYAVLRKAAEQLGTDLPSRGYSYSDDEMFEKVVRYLHMHKVRLILCLDDVEALISQEGGEPLYFLTRSREDVLRFVEERIEQLRRELQIYEELRNILMGGGAPVEPTEADLDSLPWRPYQSGTGEWVYQDEAPEALVERLRREGKPVRIGKYLYSLRVGATGKTFVSRREARTE